MSNATHETAPTEFVQVGGVRFAYRRLGRPGDLPLLLLNYLAATLEDWDPLVTNGLACGREVILFDNAGVGSSTGDTPPTVAAMTKDCVDFCRALDLMSFDVMGFSLGGMIAQQLAQDQPDMIRRMILLGAGPRGGEGMTFSELSVDELDDPVSLLMGAFFPARPARPRGERILNG
jgi:pimeloyl-ACP methyl ester carboxylesterase